MGHRVDWGATGSPPGSLLVSEAGYAVGDSGKRVIGLVPTWGWCCPYLGLRMLGEGVLGRGLGAALRVRIYLGGAKGPMACVVQRSWDGSLPWGDLGSGEAQL